MQTIYSPEINRFNAEMQKLNTYTAAMYVWAVGKYFEEKNTFSTEDVRDFLNKKTSTSTFWVFFSALKWFHRVNAESLERAGIRFYGDSIIPPKDTGRKFTPTVLSPRDIGKIIFNAPDTQKKIMLMTAYEECLRVGELMSLVVGDYDPVRGVLLVRALKGGVSREMPVPQHLNQPLQNYILWRKNITAAHHNHNLFLTAWGNKIVPRTFTTKFFTPYVKRLHREKIIPTVPRFHDFSRHSRITNWLREGVDFFTVNQLARHRKLDTTLRYIHMAPESVVDRLPEQMRRGYVPGGLVRK